MHNNMLYVLLECHDVVTEWYGARNCNFFDELPYVSVWGDDCTKKSREAINLTNNNFIVEQP